MCYPKDCRILTNWWIMRCYKKVEFENIHQLWDIDRICFSVELPNVSHELLDISYTVKNYYTRK